MTIKCTCLLIIILCFPVLIYSQDYSNLPDSNKPEQEFVIDSIVIHGNKKTKRSAILREMTVSQNDKVLSENIPSLLQENERSIKNTELFVTVNCNVKYTSKEKINIIVDVKEEWYLFPNPIFELVDRNFNEWWVDQDHKLYRTRYGIYLYHDNFTGHNDRFRIKTQLGYSYNLKFSYSTPYLDKKQRIKLKTNFSYEKKKETSYLYKYNETKYFHHESDVLEDYDFYTEIIFRKGIHKYNSFGLRYKSTWVDERIINLNPDYFANEKNFQKYLAATYKYKLDKRDFKPYPQSGHIFRFEIYKKGLGLNSSIDFWNFKSIYKKFFDLGKNFYLSSSLKGKLSFPKNQPFTLEQGLGYGTELIRGYEYYVINGQSFWLNQNAIKFKLLDITLENINLIPIKQFNTIPVKIMAKTYFDHGFVRDNNPLKNPMANNYLFGYGFGIDIVTFYEIILRLEYSFNHKNENDLFLHFKKAL